MRLMLVKLLRQRSGSRASKRLTALALALVGLHPRMFLLILIRASDANIIEWIFCVGGGFQEKSVGLDF
jgi:hypothetical protein